MMTENKSGWQRLTGWFKALFNHQPAATMTVKDGVWMQSQGAGKVLLGLDADALTQIGEVSFTDLPITDGDELAAQDDILEVESDKAVENFKTPVAGQVLRVNQALVDDPDSVNTNQMTDNWVVELKTR